MDQELSEENSILYDLPRTRKLFPETWLTVFRPFFIRINLPYSVKRGEKFALQVLIFNYMDSEQDVTVTLKDGDDIGYDFLQKDGTTKKFTSQKDIEWIEILF
ncbi:unnamed protein product [Litomosoides sigmodontis]|uniref:Alpha-2-macroglobulin domain-containing protein n=1 Tax=Litomosoides sigmodontis TaxID=42156 RepID=A0A3P7KF04_LITSI|nr:unnamed protein product [Litomosoides sigmodontis]